MSSLNVDKTGPLSWDFYVPERDEFLGSVWFQEIELEKRTCRLTWDFTEGLGEYDEWFEAIRQVTEFAIFDRKMSKINVSIEADDPTSNQILKDIGFLVGREYSEGKLRCRRYSCDRYDLVRGHAESQMMEHLDMGLWSFGWDSAKKRLGVCKYAEHLISLSRYFVDLHSLDEIDQVMRHEIAHALAGSNAGHGPKWKKIATGLGYKHIKISGDEIGNATAKLIGTCPNGHTAYRHRQPKSPLSCSRCAPRFDSRFLITWTKR